MKIGTDLVDVSRVNDKIMQKVCSEEEIQYINKYKNKNERIAGFFAVKESLIKALDLGGEIVDLKNIIISHTDSGKPYIKELKGNVKEKFQIISEKNIEISITHEKNMANAVVLLF